jgi:hypothetical protein
MSTQKPLTVWPELPDLRHHNKPLTQRLLVAVWRLAGFKKWVAFGAVNSKHGTYGYFGSDVTFIRTHRNLEATFIKPGPGLHTKGLIHQGGITAVKIF